MTYDTAGNKIWTPLLVCPNRCGLTGGCNACMPRYAIKQCDCNKYLNELCPFCEKRFYEKVTDLQTKQKNKMESIEQFKNKIIQGDLS